MMSTIPVTLAKIIRQEKSCQIIVILLAEQLQMVLPLLFTGMRSHLADMRTRAFSYYEPTTAPLTSDLIVHILDVLGGTVEEITIDTLQEDLLYAQVRLHTTTAVHTLRARLDDALLLALRLNCTLSVSENVFHTMGISLVDKGETKEQQIDAIIGMMSWLPQRTDSQAPATFNSLLTSNTPRNLDFSDALHGWMIFGYPVNPKAYEIHFDPSTTFNGKNSLAITLHDAEPAQQESFIKERMLSVTHEGFLAAGYRGQRLQMTTYVKAEDVKRANFHLAIIGPNVEPNNVRTTQHMTSTHLHPVEGSSDWTRYELVIDVPENANSIQVSFSMEGHGKIWLDSIRFAAVDKTVPLTGTRVIPPLREAENLNFTNDLEHWYLTGTFPQDYTYVIDAETSCGGAKSISIFSHKTEPRGNIVLQQTLSPYGYRGKRVRFSASIRSIGVKQQASLYISTGIGLNEEKMKRTIYGTTDWTDYEVFLDIVNPNSYINFGLILQGPGWVRMTNVHFEVIEAVH